MARRPRFRRARRGQAIRGLYWQVSRAEGGYRVHPPVCECLVLSCHEKKAYYGYALFTAQSLLVSASGFVELPRSLARAPGVESSVGMCVRWDVCHGM